MPVPLDLLIERLKAYDEIQLCELLEISSEDIVTVFVDRIRSKRSFLSEELELWEGDGEAVEEEEENEEDEDF